MPERLTTLDYPPATPETHQFQNVPAPEHVSWNIPSEFSGLLKYNPRHDIQDYLDLKSLEGKIEAIQYTERLLQTNTRTRRNLEKSLGERAVVARSTFNYSINQEGRMVSEDYQEPVVQRYRNGQEFLAENGSNETARELAEVEGMEKIEKILAEGNNTTIVIASPRSEGCKHNQDENPVDEAEDIMYHDNIFYIFVQNEGTITTTRYHSNHSNQDFLDALCEIDPDYPTPTDDKNVSASHLLANPAQTSLPVAEILEKFAVDKRTKTEEVVQRAVEDCTPMILSYIQVLINNPTDFENIKLHINATINNFDNKLKELEQQRTVDAINNFQQQKALLTERADFPVYASIQHRIQVLGRQPVESSTRGCPGKQTGFSVSSTLSTFGSSISAASVADFAPFKNLFSQDEEDRSDFPCPNCGTIITYGAGIKKCPNESCGLEATCG